MGVKKKGTRRRQLSTSSPGERRVWGECFQCDGLGSLEEWNQASVHLMRKHP